MHRISRAHSSAGERSLHTGEVQGSIPCAPTRETCCFIGFSPAPGTSATGCYRQNRAKTRHLDPWKIRGMRSWDVRSVPARPKRKTKSNARCWSSHPAALTTKVWLNACSWLQPCSGLSTGFLLRGLQVRVLLGSPPPLEAVVFTSLSHVLVQRNRMLDHFPFVVRLDQPCHRLPRQPDLIGGTCVWRERCV